MENFFLPSKTKTYPYHESYQILKLWFAEVVSKKLNNRFSKSEKLFCSYLNEYSNFLDSSTKHNGQLVWFPPLISISWMGFVIQDSLVAQKNIHWYLRLCSMMKSCPVLLPPHNTQHMNYFLPTDKESRINIYQWHA